MMPAKTGRRQEAAAGVKTRRASPLWRLPRLQWKPSALRGRCPLTPWRTRPSPAVGSPARSGSSRLGPGRELAPSALARSPPRWPGVLAAPAGSLQTFSGGSAASPGSWGRGGEVPVSPSPLLPPLPPLDRTSGGFRTLPGLWRQTHTPDS